MPGNVRHAARAAILSPENKVLLICMEEPKSGINIWITPGGGIQSGEEPIDCLHRELAEETGLDHVTIGQKIWTRRHELEWDGKEVDQREQYYLVKTDHFEPTEVNNPHEGEANWFRGFRWWTIDEIIASDTLFSPRRLGTLLKQLTTEGPPEQPIDVGV